MCKILSSKENENQNDIEIPSYQVRMAIIKETTTNAGKDVGEKEPL
jgi:hypothetical protein